MRRWTIACLIVTALVGCSRGSDGSVVSTSGDRSGLKLRDGRYPVFVGFDAGGRPTLVVVDFLLLHLRWP